MSFPPLLKNGLSLPIKIWKSMVIETEAILLLKIAAFSKWKKAVKMGKIV